MQSRPLPPTDDQRIDAGNLSELVRWADVLCTTPEQIKRAIETCGPRVGDVKRCLLLMLVRRHNRTAPMLRAVDSGP